MFEERMNEEGNVKLLVHEYPDLYEPIIIETAFAQVSEFGYGQNMLQIALTAAHLYFARDNFELVNLKNFNWSYIDPEYETLELVSVMPLDSVRINFCMKGERNIMEIAVRGKEEHPKYFELGGNPVFRNLIWNTWQERICTLRLTQAKTITFSVPTRINTATRSNKICFVVEDHESVTESILRSARGLTSDRNDLIVPSTARSIRSGNSFATYYSPHALERRLTL